MSTLPASALPASALRVVEAARALALDVEVREMAASTRTADEAAAACDCTVGQIVKSLVFRGRTSGQPWLLLVSGANRVDEKGIAAGLGEALKRTDAEEVRTLTGFAIGGIPPFGHTTALATVMDEDLLAHATVWAAAGTPHAVFPIAPTDLAKATNARILRVK